MSDAPQSQLVLYRASDGQTRIQCRFVDETVWLTQKLMSELFQKDVRTINEHILNVFAGGELSPESVIRKFRITAADGKTYETQHYNLDVIISVARDPLPSPAGRRAGDEGVALPHQQTIARPFLSHWERTEVRARQRVAKILEA